MGWSRFRSLLQTIHLWIGLALGIPFILLGLSGSILVYHEDIDALFADPTPRASAGESRPLADILAAAQTHAPEGSQPATLTLPVEQGDPATVRFTRPAGETAGPPGRGPAVAVDPVTLEIMDTPPPPRGAITGFMHDLHGHLLVRGWGRKAVGWIGAAMLFLGVSGLVMWWPKKGGWRWAFGVKKGARGFRLNRDLHGMTGFWGLIVYLIVMFSGVYIVFPQTLGGFIGSVFPASDLRAALNAPRVNAPEGVTPMNADEAVALAQSAVPDAEPRSLTFATRSEQPTRVIMHWEGHAERTPLITVLIDPYARAVMHVQDPRQYSAGETITSWQRAVHEGAGLGPLWRFLVFLSGLLPLLFAITGFRMWQLKRRLARAPLSGAVPVGAPAE